MVEETSAIYTGRPDESQELVVVFIDDMHVKVKVKLDGWFKRHSASHHLDAYKWSFMYMLILQHSIISHIRNCLFYMKDPLICQSVHTAKLSNY